jgi:hypothetical protein
LGEAAVATTDTTLKASAIRERAHHWHVPRVVVSGRRVSVLISLAVLAFVAFAAGAAGLMTGIGLALVLVAMLLVDRISSQMSAVPLVDDHVLAIVGLAEIDRELARARRFERPFAVARLSFGSLVSLADVGETIEQVARRFDQYFFDGCDEVLLLMPETSVDLAKSVTERVAAGVLEVGSDAVLVGVAGFPGPSTSAVELLAAAAPTRRIEGRR